MLNGAAIAAKPSRRTNRAPSKTSYSAERSDSYVLAAVEARVLNKSLD